MLFDPRRDAQRNREALLTAARSCFAEQGMEAPLEQVAKRAGVAIGTLYRHFPTRLDLVQATSAEKLAAWREAAEKAVTMDDAWAGLCHFLETMCELQSQDRGFNDLASMRLAESACLAGAQTRIRELGVHIVERAQEQGSLRPDLTPRGPCLRHLVAQPRHRGHPRHRPGRLAPPPLPSARRLPNRPRPPAAGTAAHEALVLGKEPV